MFYGGGNNINVKIFGIEDFYGNVWQGNERYDSLMVRMVSKNDPFPPYNFDGTGYVATGVKAFWNNRGICIGSSS